MRERAYLQALSLVLVIHMLMVTLIIMFAYFVYRVTLLPFPGMFLSLLVLYAITVLDTVSSFCSTIYRNRLFRFHGLGNPLVSLPMTPRYVINMLLIPIIAIGSRFSPRRVPRLNINMSFLQILRLQSLLYWSFLNEVALNAFFYTFFFGVFVPLVLTIYIYAASHLIILDNFAPLDSMLWVISAYGLVLGWPSILQNILEQVGGRNGENQQNNRP
ncbi:hypothetical protein F4678DRAFT_447621 [Xylaria arbuscula]|nr:hypothetical protein F4678DRAFT_447621 [Xylaria arbuscula]